MRRLSLTSTAILIVAIVAAGCSKQQKAPETGGAARGTPVTVTNVTTTKALVTESVLGRVESGTSPQVIGEVQGTVARVNVDVGQHVKEGQTLAELDTTDLRIALETARSEVGRLEALHAAQERTAQRMDKLHEQKLISQGMYDDSQAQLKSLAEQLAGARARHASAQRSLAKGHISAPVSGTIQARRIAPGDYVDGRSPVFLITSDSKLRIHLPFPEGMASQLRPGLAVRLTSPMAPNQSPVLATVDSISPSVGDKSHAVEAIVHVANPGNWSEGASVTGEVVIDEHPNALMVPEVSVVRRPAGDVVYAVKGEIAEQRVVTTGARQDGMVEILSGLQPGDVVVVDGAGFLTDKAPILVKK